MDTSKINIEAFEKLKAENKELLNEIKILYLDYKTLLKKFNLVNAQLNLLKQNNTKTN